MVGPLSSDARAFFRSCILEHLLSHIQPAVLGDIQEHIMTQLQGSLTKHHPITEEAGGVTLDTATARYLAKRHLIIENAEELAVDDATAQYLVALDLIYDQGEDPTVNHYHIVDPHSWDDVERSIALFNARPLPKRTVEAAVAELAADAFWTEVVGGFPEMTTGDTQLTDEDVGAFYLWLTGVDGDYANHPIGWAPANVPPIRIDAVLAKGIATAQVMLARINPALPTAPAAVVSRLRQCLHHQLEWNFPSEGVPRRQQSEGNGAA
ncbi:hypothetical protein WT31_09645 [Burkholderia territorii]|nr:hypothetical protein WT31_09645 [Burkholderia territorii]